MVRTPSMIMSSFSQMSQKHKMDLDVLKDLSESNKEVKLPHTFICKHSFSEELDIPCSVFGFFVQFFCCFFLKFLTQSTFVCSFRGHYVRWSLKSYNQFTYCQSTIMPSRSFQGESSVLRVRLRVLKNPLQIHTSPLQKCTSRTNMH